MTSFANFPNPEFARALDQFDAGDYYDCHETLEDLWRAETRDVRDVYKGVLMIAVGLYHDRRGKRAGPLRTFNRAVELLEPFGPHCLGLDIAETIKACRRMRAHLVAVPEGERVPDHLIPKMRYLLTG